MVKKMFFFWNNSKNIDIRILCKEQNLFTSEFYMFVHSLVKIDWEMPVKNPIWPPRNLVFCYFKIRPRLFPVHHRDRLVLFYFNLLGLLSKAKLCLMRTVRDDRPCKLKWNKISRVNIKWLIIPWLSMWYKAEQNKI